MGSVIYTLTVTGNETAAETARQLPKSPLADAAGSIALLILFMVALLVGAWFLRRGPIALRGRRAARVPGRALTLVDRVSVDRESAVLLIEWEGERYLIGMGGSGMRLLDKRAAVENADESVPAAPLTGGLSRPSAAAPARAAAPLPNAGDSWAPVRAPSTPKALAGLFPAVRTPAKDAPQTAFQTLLGRMGAKPVRRTEPVEVADPQDITGDMELQIALRRQRLERRAPESGADTQPEPGAGEAAE